MILSADPDRIDYIMFSDIIKYTHTGSWLHQHGVLRSTLTGVLGACTIHNIVFGFVKPRTFMDRARLSRPRWRAVSRRTIRLARSPRTIHEPRGTSCRSTRRPSDSCSCRRYDVRNVFPVTGTVARGTFYLPNNTVRLINCVRAILTAPPTVRR